MKILLYFNRSISKRLCSISIFIMEFGDVYMVRARTRSVLVVRARTIELYKPCLHIVRARYVRLNTLNLLHIPRPRINAPCVCRFWFATCKIAKTSNVYISGNGSVLKVNMFMMWLNLFAKLVNVIPFFAVFF